MDILYDYNDKDTFIIFLFRTFLDMVHDWYHSNTGLNKRTMFFNENLQIIGNQGYMKESLNNSINEILNTVIREFSDITGDDIVRVFNRIFTKKKINNPEEVFDNLWGANPEGKSKILFDYVYSSYNQYQSGGDKRKHSQTFKKDEYYEEIENMDSKKHFSGIHIPNGVSFFDSYSIFGQDSRNFNMYNNCPISIMMDGSLHPCLEGNNMKYDNSLTYSQNIVNYHIHYNGKQFISWTYNILPNSDVVKSKTYTEIRLMGNPIFNHNSILNDRIKNSLRSASIILYLFLKNLGDSSVNNIFKNIKDSRQSQSHSNSQGDNDPVVDDNDPDVDDIEDEYIDDMDNENEDDQEMKIINDIRTNIFENIFSYIQGKVSGSRGNKFIEDFFIKMDDNMIEFHLIPLLVSKLGKNIIEILDIFDGNNNGDIKQINEIIYGEFIGRIKKEPQRLQDEISKELLKKSIKKKEKENTRKKYIDKYGVNMNSHSLSSHYYRKIVKQNTLPLLMNHYQNGQNKDRITFGIFLSKWIGDNSIEKLGTVTNNSTVITNDRSSNFSQIIDAISYAHGDLQISVNGNYVNHNNRIFMARKGDKNKKSLKDVYHQNFQSGGSYSMSDPIEERINYIDTARLNTKTYDNIINYQLNFGEGTTYKSYILSILLRNYYDTKDILRQTIQNNNITIREIGREIGTYMKMNVYQKIENDINNIHKMINYIKNVVMIYNSHMSQISNVPYYNNSLFQNNYSMPISVGGGKRKNKKNNRFKDKKYI